MIDESVATSWGFSAARLADALLGTIERDVLPLTKRFVSEGNKIFGGSVLLKADLRVVVAGTNLETECPLWHGEVATIKKFYEMASPRPAVKDCVFVSTHEPCAMCLSAIAWAGFDRFIYLFDYEQTAHEFNIPHDLDMLSELFACRHGAYVRHNAYWIGISFQELVEACRSEERDDLMRRAGLLTEAYRRLSEQYQRSKSLEPGSIPLP